MYLKRLILENVRCIGDLELDCRGELSGARKWTMFLGENGSGKTTVLRAIALLTSGSDAFTELLGDPGSWVSNGRHDCKLYAEILRPPRRKLVISFRIRRPDTIFEVLRNNEAAFVKLDAALKTDSETSLVAAYGASRSQGTDRTAEEVFRSSHSRCVATLFSTQARLYPLNKWAVERHYEFGDKGLDLIRKTLNKILTGPKFHSIKKDTQQLLFDTPDGLVPFDYLSEGFQGFAAVMGDFVHRLTARPGIKKIPWKLPGMLLIDEIDLHLHPQWQRDVRSYLDNNLPNFQIFTTTHSPLTAQQTSDGELFCLGKESPNDPSSIRAFEGNPSRLMIHQLLASPIFKMIPSDSSEIQFQRAEYRRLLARRKRSGVDETRLRQLKTSIDSLPHWDEYDRNGKERLAVLKDIQKTLHEHGKRQR